jgi:5,10-methylenetetrahydromethanopterin reductase
VKVDLRVPPCQPVNEIVEFCQRVEAAGFSGVGFVDSQLYLRDTYVVIAEVLQSTETLRVHPALTCPGPRHSSIIASAAKTVQEFGPDRFELWLGRGGSANRAVGLPQLKMREMAESMRQIRDLMEGKPNVFEGVEGFAEGGLGARKYVDAGAGPRMYLGGGKPIPIILAVGGPLVSRLAGSMSDGVLLCAGPTQESIEEMRGWVAEGAVKADRHPREVDEWLQMRCLVRDTREEAIRAWSPNLPAVLNSPQAEEWLAKRGIDFKLTDEFRAQVAEAHEALRRLYPEEIHIMDWDAAVRICQVIPYELQEAMGDVMAVLGPPDYVVDRMKVLESYGCEKIYLYPCWTFQLPEPELRAFEEVIGPAFGQRKHAAWQTYAR